MNKTTHAGIAKESWDELIRTIAAVQAKKIIVLHPERIPPKETKKIRRRLKAAHDLHLDSGVIWHASGVSVSAIASWIAIVDVDINGSGRRYRLLAIDRHGERSLFAIPIDMVDKLDELPSTGYSAAEVKLLLLMANEVSDQKAAREYHVASPHPANDDILRQRSRWREEPDRAALIRIFRQRDWLMPIIAAALDVQLRSFKFFSQRPARHIQFYPI